MADAPETSPLPRPSPARYETPMQELAANHQATEVINMSNVESAFDTFTMKWSLEPHNAETGRIIDALRSDETEQMVLDISRAGFDALTIPLSEGMTEASRIEAIFKAAQELATQEELTVAPDIKTSMDEVPMPNAKFDGVDFTALVTPTPESHRSSDMPMPRPVPTETITMDIALRSFQSLGAGFSEGYDTYKTEVSDIVYSDPAMRMMLGLSKAGVTEFEVRVSEGMTETARVRAIYEAALELADEKNIALGPDLPDPPERGSFTEILQDPNLVGFSADPDMDKMLYYSEQYDALVILEKGKGPVLYEPEQPQQDSAFKEFYAQALDAAVTHPDFHKDGMPTLHTGGPQGVSEGTENIVDGSAEFWQIAGKTAGLVANRFPVAAGLLKGKELWQKHQFAENFERADLLTPEANEAYQDLLIAEATYGLASTVNSMRKSPADGFDTPQGLPNKKLGETVEGVVEDVAVGHVFQSDFAKWAAEHNVHPNIQKLLKPGSTWSDVKDIGGYSVEVISDIFKQDMLPPPMRLQDGSIRLLDANRMMYNAQSMLSEGDGYGLGPGETQADADNILMAMRDPRLTEMLKTIGRNNGTIDAEFTPGESLIQRTGTILVGIRDKAIELGYEPPEAQANAAREASQAHYSNDDSYDAGL